MCVHTNKRYNTYQTGFASCGLGHAPGVGLWGVGVPKGVKKNQTRHVAYQIDGDDEQNRVQVKFSSQGLTGDLEGEVKGQISLNLDYHVNSKSFIPIFVCVLTNKIL